MISAFELADLHQAFFKLDEDGSGTLTVDEIRAGSRDLGLDRVGDLDGLFRKIDIDGSGEVDYHEFIEGYTEFASASLQSKFDKLDTDGNGSLTLEEMRAGIDELGIREDQVELLFRRLDADGGGSIDYSEFAQKLLSQMTGSSVGLGERGTGIQNNRFSTLGAKGLQVEVFSLEALPHRAPRQTAATSKEIFAVRLSWPSRPNFGHSEVCALEAHVWGTPRVRRPTQSHGAYVPVEHTLRLPWVNGRTSAILAVYETDLLDERLVGEAVIPMDRQLNGRMKQYLIRGRDGSVEGKANVRVSMPAARHKFLVIDHSEGGSCGVSSSGRPPGRFGRRGAKKQATEWSPFGLCNVFRAPCAAMEDC